MLADLLTYLRQSSYECNVVVLSSHVGPILGEIQKLGVSVQVLPLNNGVFQALKNLVALALLLRRIRPDVVQSWMYHADLIGGTIAKLTTQAQVVWGVFNDLLHPRMKMSTKLIIKLCAPLSYLIPNRIICCSEKCFKTHERFGYDRIKMRIAMAGIDFRAFRPDKNSYAWLRQQLKLSPDAVVIGLIARYAPEKDHLNFAKAAAEILRRRPNVHFLLCGQGIDWENSDLVAILKQEKLTEKVFLMGRAKDLVRIMQGLSLAVLTSSTESFGLVVAEALSCGIVTVGTDVGEVRNIIRRQDLVVPPQEPLLLAEACLSALALTLEEKDDFLSLARKRIESDFSIISMVEKFKENWQQVLVNSEAK